MDTLALLCNLHADGPETLQLLRRAGLDTLAEVEAAEAADLGRVLATSELRAGRFQREARHLRERLEPAEPGEPREPGGAGEADSKAPARPGLSGRGVAELELPARDLLIPRPVGKADASPRLPAISAARPTSLPSPPLAESVIDVTFELEIPLEPEPTGSATEPTGLTPGDVDGLDEATCASLRGAGIESLADLAAVPTLELVEETGLDFTRLARLQFLARRAPAAGPAQAPASRPGREPTAGEAGHAGDGVAGPFA